MKKIRLDSGVKKGVYDALVAMIGLMHRNRYCLTRVKSPSPGDLTPAFCNIQFDSKQGA